MTDSSSSHRPQREATHLRHSPDKQDTSGSEINRVINPVISYYVSPTETSLKLLFSLELTLLLVLLEVLLILRGLISVQRDFRANERRHLGQKALQWAQQTILAVLSISEPGKTT